MKNIRMTRQIWGLICWSCLSLSGCLATVSDGTSSSGEEEELESTEQAARDAPRCDECDKICDPYTGHYKDLCIRACQKTCVGGGAAVCGNHFVEAGEECDDGNTVSGDGCSSTCKTEPPPPPVCGNGKLESGEQCDDGNTVSGDGCSSTCKTELPPVCGNHFVESGEQCDDGNTVNGDGCSSTCKIEAPPSPVCGNGKLESGEQCDDGNTVSNDGCSSGCRNEFCGDGTKQTNEQCDDGNTVNNDGCSATCTLEPRCGDGIKQGSEQCDDGNQVNGDGCENDCTVTPVVGPTCDSCRSTHCRDFQGVDLVAGCFQAVDGDFGADPGDPNFIQQCVNIVHCAQQNHCAYSAEKQAAGCYCGSATIDACAATGPAADAPCVAAWQAGARSTVNAEVQVRFTDLAYPAGWAYFILDCDRTNCNSAAVGDCTKP